MVLLLFVSGLLFCALHQPESSHVGNTVLITTALDQVFQIFHNVNCTVQTSLSFHFRLPIFINPHGAGDLQGEVFDKYMLI